MIKVTGQGSVQVTPDLASLNAGVMTESESLAKATAENSKIAEQIIQAWKQLGIKSEDIQTNSYRVEPQYDFIEGKQQFRGYKVTHLFEVSNIPLAMTGSAVDAAVQSGANVVGNVTFSSSKEDALYLQALQRALLDGHQKAGTIATTYGRILNPTPFEVVELSDRAPRSVMHESAAFASSAPPIQGGLLEVQANVQLQYRLQM